MKKKQLTGFIYGYTRIQRGNRVRHIPVQTEWRGYCGARLEDFYRTTEDATHWENVCPRCLPLWKSAQKKTERKLATW